MIGNNVIMHHRKNSSKVTRCLQKIYLPNSCHHLFYLAGRKQNSIEYGYAWNQSLQRKTNIERTWGKINKWKRKVEHFLGQFTKERCGNKYSNFFSI